MAYHFDHFNDNQNKLYNLKAKIEELIGEVEETYDPNGFDEIGGGKMLLLLNAHDEVATIIASMIGEDAGLAPDYKKGNK